jgi:hypothetical protein
MEAKIASSRELKSNNYITINHYERLICIFIALLILITQIIMVACKIRNHVPAVIVFGDSSVDSGNNNKIATLLKSNFKPYGRDFEGGRPTGRFCNGRVPPDFIAEAFGVKKNIPAYLDPAYTIDDFVTGVCFASAGTGYDNATSDVLVSFFFSNQVFKYSFSL